MTCFLSLMFAMSLSTPCETWVRTGLARPYAFSDILAVRSVVRLNKTPGPM